MLNCPPTRLSLTSADLSSFERRSAARRAQMNRAHVRLGRGPKQLTSLSIVPADANEGRKRAASCSSQATVCSDERAPSGVTATCPEKANMLDDHVSATPSESLAGAAGPQIMISPPSARSKTEILTGDPVSRIEQPRPKPANEEDFSLYEDPPALQRLVEARHIEEWHTRELEDRIRRAGHPAEVWAAERSETINQASTDSNLDPGAPVFVPRLRFGSSAAAGSRGFTRAEARIDLLPPAGGSSRLYPHSSSEDNVRQMAQEAQGVAVHITHDFQFRRRSRTREQNNVLLSRPGEAERRISSRFLGNVPITRRNSGSYRHVVFPHRQSSPQHLTNFERARRSQEASEQERHPTHLAVPRHNSSQPRISESTTSSVSTPNLLRPLAKPRVQSRSSSLSWRRNHTDALSGEHSVAANPHVGGDSSTDTLYTTLERLALHRDSPLDELAQQLSRLSARPRSVGQSFEQPPTGHPRVSLLSGDPFRLNPPLERFLELPIVDAGLDHHSTGPFTHDATIFRISMLNTSSSTAPRPQVRVAPQASPEDSGVAQNPFSSSSNVTAGTPFRNAAPPAALRAASGSSPFTHIPSSSHRLEPPQTNSSPIARSLVGASVSRVTMYSDGQPEEVQAQAPAGIARFRRRLQNRSDTTTLHQPPSMDAVLTATVVASERPYRHTYPASIVSQSPDVELGEVLRLVCRTDVRRNAVMEQPSQSPSPIMSDSTEE